MIARFHLTQNPVNKHSKKEKDKTNDTTKEVMGFNPLFNPFSNSYPVSPFSRQDSVGLFNNGDVETKQTDDSKDKKKNIWDDCIEGPVPKWLLPFTGIAGLTINALAD